MADSLICSLHVINACPKMFLSREMQRSVWKCEETTASSLKQWMVNRLYLYNAYVVFMSTLRPIYAQHSIRIQIQTEPFVRTLRSFCPFPQNVQKYGKDTDQTEQAWGAVLLSLPDTLTNNSSCKEEERSCELVRYTSSTFAMFVCCWWVQYTKTREYNTRTYNSIII